MGHVLVAAWIGVMVGWIGFGWILAEAPSDNLVRLAAVAPHVQDGGEQEAGLRVGGVHRG